MEEKTNPWLQIISEVQQKIDPNSFETWFEPAAYIGQERDDLYIKVPNAYFKDWLSFHYSAMINEASKKIFGKAYEIKYIFDESSLTFMRKSPDERRTRHGMLLNPNLNPNYTFENFVVGSCNQFAHAACTAVSKNPARAYNPI